jgi:hypothetical protein
LQLKENMMELQLPMLLPAMNPYLKLTTNTKPYNYKAIQENSLSLIWNHIYFYCFVGYLCSLRIIYSIILSFSINLLNGNEKGFYIHLFYIFYNLNKIWKKLYVGYSLIIKHISNAEKLLKIVKCHLNWLQFCYLKHYLLPVK